MPPELKLGGTPGYLDIRFSGKMGGAYLTQMPRFPTHHSNSSWGATEGNSHHLRQPFGKMGCIPQNLKMQVSGDHPPPTLSLLVCARLSEDYKCPIFKRSLLTCTWRFPELRWGFPKYLLWDGRMLQEISWSGGGVGWTWLSRI